MNKLEKLLFWITLSTFVFPLATNVGGYRLNLFEIPLWGVYFLWAFRFGLKDQRLRLVKYDGYFVLFLLWLLISLVYNNAWQTGANEWLFWVKCYLIGFYLRHNLYRFYSLSSVVIFLVVAISLEVGLGLLQGVTQSSIGAVQQYFGQEMEHIAIYKAGLMSLVRVQGTFRHPNILGNWIVLLLPLIMAKGLMSRGRARLIYWLCGMAALTALVLTLSRGNWAAVVFGLVVMLYATGALVLKRVNWGRTIIATIIASVYVAVLATAFFDKLTPFSTTLSQRVEMLPGSQSETIRYSLLLASSQLISDSPILGVGLGRSNELLHYTEYEIGDRFSATVHNIFMIIATEGGLVACWLFLLAIWQPLKHVHGIAKAGRKKSTTKLTGLLAAGLVGGYSAILFAMLWYTGMVEQAELPLILTYFNLAMGMKTDEPAVTKKEAAASRIEAGTSWRPAQLKSPVAIPLPSNSHN